MQDNTNRKLIVVNRKGMHKTPFRDEIIDLFMKRNFTNFYINKKATYDVNKFFDYIEELFGLRIELVDKNKAFSYKSRIQKSSKYMYIDIFTIIATFPKITNYEIQKCLIGLNAYNIRNGWKTSVYLRDIVDEGVFDELVFLSLETLMKNNYIQIYRYKYQHYKNAYFVCLREFVCNYQAYYKLQHIKIPTEKQHIENLQLVFGRAKSISRIKEHIREKKKYTKKSCIGST